MASSEPAFSLDCRSRGGGFESRRLRQAKVEVDILVNKGAVYPSGRLFRVESGVLRQTFEIHFLGATWARRAFVRGLRAATMAGISGIAGRFLGRRGRRSPYGESRQRVPRPVSPRPATIPTKSRRSTPSVVGFDGPGRRSAEAPTGGS